MALLDVLKRALEIISDGQWVYGYNDWGQSFHECPTCGESHYHGERSSWRHKSYCSLHDTIQELTILVAALEAKEASQGDDGDGVDIPPEDPVEICSRRWLERLTALEATATGKVTAATARADGADRKLAEFVQAAKEYGWASDRLRKLLG